MTEGERKLPICDICAKTGLLCSACESKLSGGRITELDVELSRILYELTGGEIGFERAIDIKDFVIILANKGDLGKVIGKSGSNIRVISSKLGKQVRVIGTGNIRDMIYDLLAPARISGVNKVFKPDGSTFQRVRISKKDQGKLRMSIEDVSKIVSSLSEEKIEISLE